MPFTTVSSVIAALSIAGAPPFACFMSEFLIFVGAFQVINVDSFYLIPTALNACSHSALLSLLFTVYFQSILRSTKN